MDATKIVTASDVIGRFARGDTLELEAISVDVVLLRAQISPSAKLDEQLLRAHTKTQADLLLERTCRSCGKHYVECENVGRWRCRRHYARWDIVNERWACCMMRSHTADGCIGADHTDDTRDVLDAISVPAFLQTLICKPLPQALASAECPYRLLVRPLGTDEFVTALELYAQYASTRQVLLLRTNYLFVVEELKERRRKCNAL